MSRRLFADSSVPDALESQNARCKFNAPGTDESPTHPWHHVSLAGGPPARRTCLKFPIADFRLPI
jgi:hypothetical protein